MELAQNEVGKGRYLIFKLDNEDYALEVHKIKEIIKYTKVTEVPNASCYVKGVISLRGVVVPVLDIKKCFGIPDKEPTKMTRIIVVNYKEQVAGLPVDSIDEVKNISSDTMVPLPKFGEREKLEFLKGIIEFKDKFILVLKTSVLLDRLKYGY